MKVEFPESTRIRPVVSRDFVDKGQLFIDY